MKSIRRQVTVNLLIAFLLLWMIAGVSIYSIFRTSLISEYDLLLKARATAIAALTELTPRFLIIGHAPKIGPASGSNRNEEFLQISTVDGTIKLRTSNLKNSNLEIRHGSIEQPIFWDLKLPDGSMGRAIGFQFMPEVEIDPEDENSLNTFTPSPLIMIFAKTRTELDEALSGLSHIFILTILAGLLGTFFLVRFIFLKSLFPLKEVSELANRIEAETLQLRFPTHSIPIELAPIIHRLNHLLERLEESFERERRFSASVAHELRTPIAELRSMVEVAIKWPEEQTKPQELLGEILGISIQMERMVSSLLALARCETGKQAVHLKVTDVEKLIRETWIPFQERAKSKKISIHMDLIQPLQIKTDPALLEAVLNNLFWNAVEYTPPHGIIRIEEKTMEDPHRFKITIENTVENITQEDLKRFSERFWRKDEARSSSEHAGLGLSLCKAFLELLNISMTFDLKSSHLLSIELEGRIS